MTEHRDGRRPGAVRAVPPGAASWPPAPRSEGVPPWLALSAIWFGGVLAIALWWHDTPVVSGLGDWLTNAGRITGLLAGYGIVVLLILMARVPALDRGVGTDRLARWHAAGGRYVVSLVVAHGLLIWWGYAVTAHAGLATQGKSLLLSYPDVLMGTVAGLLLVMVGVVSARAARRRMRYETWYYLHFYTYLAVALAFSHQFSTGADFVTNRPARVLWSALYLFGGGLILWYRWVTPVRQAVRHRLRVGEVREEAPGVFSVFITGDHLDELRSEPGQFFRWRFLTRDLWWSANPYSLSAAPHPKWLRITVKDLGDHSTALRTLRPGTKVFAEGPFGAFTPARQRRRKVLLLGGGVGVTPLRALFQTLPGDVRFVYRASRDDDVVFRRELDAIAAARGSRVHYLLGSRRQLGYDPLAAERLLQLVPDLAERDVYLCGPPGMTAAARAQLRRAGVRRRAIHTESFEF